MPTSPSPPDLDADRYQQAVDALTAQRTVYAQYLQIVDGQQAALRMDSVRTMTRLAARLDSLIAEIQRLGRGLAPTYRLLASGTRNGPRCRHLRDLMTAVAADAALAHANVRDLTERLLVRRDRVMADLDALEPQVVEVGGRRTSILDTAG